MDDCYSNRVLEHGVTHMLVCTVGLLQLSLVSFARHPFAQVAVGTKHDCMTHNWYMMSQTYHTSAICQLYWLLIRKWIQFKVTCLVHQLLLLSSQAPAYLAAECNLLDSGHHSLLSANVRTCAIPCTNSSCGDRSFAAGPHLWNWLPLNK